MRAMHGGRFCAVTDICESKLGEVVREELSGFFFSCCGKLNQSHSLQLRPELNQYANQMYALLNLLEMAKVQSICQITV